MKKKKIRRRSRYRQSKKHARRTATLKKLMIGVSLAIVAVFALGLILPKSETPTSKKKQPVPPPDVTLSLLCVGDIMLHTPQIMAQYDSEKGAYVFDDNYKYVKSYIQRADLAMCNLETTFAGKPYSGYPQFCAPDSLADTLKDTGFDVAFTANNHMVDKGEKGVTRTLEVLKEKGIGAVGSVMQSEDPRYILQQVKGVNIGIIAYTYETGSGGAGTSVNGQQVSSSVADRINTFHMNTIEEDQKKIKASIDAARSAGAEIIIAYYHWGDEYEKNAADNQKELAKNTAEMGADVIFASHPHVLQETQYIKLENTGKIVPVFYSMGNFISNQRKESLGNRFTEQGVMAEVNLVYAKSEGKIKEISMGGTPTWVDRYSSSGKDVYRIIPLDENLAENETLADSGHLSRAKQALEDANEILGLDRQKN
jgi:poly-gamma-glutamate synthesis protein (capsule biosynthesis protein)